MIIHTIKHSVGFFLNLSLSRQWEKQINVYSQCHLLFISILFRTVTITVSPIEFLMVIITIRFGWTPRITIIRILIDALVVDFSIVSERESTKLPKFWSRKDTSSFCQANWKQKKILFILLKGSKCQLEFSNNKNKTTPELAQDIFLARKLGFSGTEAASGVRLSPWRAPVRAQCKIE